MFKGLENKLAPVPQSFLSWVYRQMTAAAFHDKIPPDLFDRLINDALRIKDATRENIEQALKHSRTLIEIVEGRWKHKTFNCPPLCVLNDAVSFLEIVRSVIDGNEFDIQTETYFDMLPVEYQTGETKALIREYIPRGCQYMATNIQYSIDAKPKSFHAFLRYALQKDAGRTAREREIKMEAERQRAEHEKRLEMAEAVARNKHLRDTMELTEWPEMSREVIEWYKGRYPKSDFPIADDTSESGLMARAHYALNKRKYGTFERYDSEGRMI